MALILVVEDNLDYREVLVNFLESAEYRVMAAADGVEALELAGKYDFDLVLLDLMLPKIDGYGVCEMLRKDSDVPVIMLTALGSEEHQIKGYNLYIDDYITKPVSMAVLLHKVAAVLRRASHSGADCLCYHNISLDLKGHTVSVAGKDVGFTLREFEILLELMQAPGEVITRQSLLTKLWGYEFYGDTRIVDTHIKNIRKKLGGGECIETVRGVGYKMQRADGEKE
ncbi:MAG: response regulator transcription factor [Lachnospiraceae bacterium]|nr:response regulator transcription factor [Lachnospiraceae bacterium]